MDNSNKKKKKQIATLPKLMIKTGFGKQKTETDITERQTQKNNKISNTNGGSKKKKVSWKQQLTEEIQIQSHKKDLKQNQPEWCKKTIEETECCCCCNIF